MRNPLPLTCAQVFKTFKVACEERTIKGSEDRERKMSRRLLWVELFREVQDTENSGGGQRLLKKNKKRK